MTVDEFKKLVNECETDEDFKKLYKKLPLFRDKHIKIKELVALKNNELSFESFVCANPNCNNLTLRRKQNYCCNKCCRSDEVTRNKIKASWEHGKEERCQHMKDTNSKRTKEFYVERKKKYIKTMVEKYGVESNTQLEKNRERARKTALETWNNKTEEEKLKFGQKMKQINTGRPSVSGFANKTEEEKLLIKKKQYETKKRNHSFNSSVPEDKIKNILIQKFPDFKYQYRSELYPFACDFYIPEFDLYIEFQGTWIHGKNGKTILGAYDKNNREHQKVLSIWQEKAKNSKFYEIAINVWTIRDPLKREIAKKNNLNWLEFFTLDEFINWYNSLD